jgi:hypothetical protein
MRIVIHVPIRIIPCIFIETVQVPHILSRFNDCVRMYYSMLPRKNKISIKLSSIAYPLSCVPFLSECVVLLFLLKYFFILCYARYNSAEYFQTKSLYQGL